MVVEVLPYNAVVPIIIHINPIFSLVFMLFAGVSNRLFGEGGEVNPYFS